MPYDRNELQNLADELRNLFTIEKENQLRRSYRPHPKSNKNEYWLKGAEICLDIGAKPIDYIKSAFSFNSIPGGPFPSIYGGKAIKKYYKDYVKDLDVGSDTSVYEELVKFEVKTVFEECHRRYKRTGIPIRETLADETMPFASYTRIALSPGDPEILLKYKEKVKEVIKLNPQLRLILEKLKINVSKIYE